MDIDIFDIKVAAITTELSRFLPIEIPLMEIAICARQLVKDYKAINTAYTEENRLKLVN